MNEKNKIYIYIGICIFIGLYLWAGIGLYTLNGKLRQVEINLNKFESTIANADTTLKQLKTDYSRIAEIAGRWEEGNRKLDNIYRAIEAGNRREEEIYSGITKSVGSLQDRFGILQTSFGKFEQEYIDFANSISGNQQLISEALDILGQLPKRSQ